MVDNVKVWNKEIVSGNVHSAILTVMNGVLKLTKKELEVASALYKRKSFLNKGVSINSISNKLLFSVETKREIRGELGMSNLLFNNYLQILRDKNVIFDTDDGKILNPSLELNPEKDFSVSFKFKVKA
jgi:hypothetical protein